MNSNRLKVLLLGKPQDPLAPSSRQNIALVAFLAWVGLGADGLSSSCYGPALGFLALKQYEHLALFLTLLTCATVFIIAMSYNQVIELFPNGGGGYKVANELLGPTAGVVSGAALLIDYMLTIAISVAAGVHAIYSLLPVKYQSHIVLSEVLVTLFLMLLNVRGMKESIKFLLPIFMGFVISHLAIIVYGITAHGSQLPNMIHQTVKESHVAIQNFGLFSVMAILLRAYSLGSGTYTGLEAVSNNVNMLAEPRVQTGKWTMMYMATSLSIVAGGIILLYLLWHVHPVHGMTLNAAVFQDILGKSYWGHIGLIMLLVFEAGLLLVGANTGYLGGPAVLANMSHDDWVPRRFSGLSSRLVKQNGVLFFGVSAILTLLLTSGHVETLVIFYSVNVFITFTVSLIGLVKYWWQQRKTRETWLRPMILSLVASTICSIILVVILISKFTSGSGVAILITLVVISGCMLIKRYYDRYEKLKRQLDRTLEVTLSDSDRPTRTIDRTQPTAVFLVSGLGAALHTMLWVERMFPAHFKNYVFLSYGWVDTGSFGSDTALQRLQAHTERTVMYLSNFCQHHDIATTSVTEFGTTPMESVTDLAQKISEEYTNAVFFASRYVYRDEPFLSRLLHSDFSLVVQRKLQSIGTKMLIVPLQLDP